MTLDLLLRGFKYRLGTKEQNRHTPIKNARNIAAILLIPHGITLPKLTRLSIPFHAGGIQIYYHSSLLCGTILR